MPGFVINSQGGDLSPGSADAKAEFNRAHRWVINTLGEPAASSARTQSKGGSNPIVYAKTLKLPSVQFEDLIIEGGSSSYSFAKNTKWQPVEISFYDVEGLYDILKAWREKIWTADKGMGVADEYKGEPQFSLLDGGGQPTFQFTLKGAYPKVLSHGELNYTSSDIKLVMVTFVYDYAEDSKGGAGQSSNRTTTGV